MSAPAARAALAFASVETVPNTRAPSARHIWQSSRPIPPAAAWTSTGIPDCTRNVERTR